MNVTKYQNIIKSKQEIEKKYNNMFPGLQKDIRNNCKLKMSAIAKDLNLSTAMLRYYFRKKSMSNTLLKKLLKLVSEN